MLTSLKILLEQADRGGYAVPAFNFNNLEMLQAIVSAAVKTRSPVILQTSEGAVKYAGMDYLTAMVQVAAKADVLAALHLDHGKDLNIIKQAIDSGYTSIMFDGSLLSFEENVRATWRIVQWAHTRGVSVEAELGAIRGIEDLVSVRDREAFLTNPEQAKEFVNQTDCDALAVSIGTAHGAYKFHGTPKLDLKRLKQIRGLVSTPLVLHGASGLPDWLIKQAKRTGLKIAGAKGVSNSLIKKAIALGVRKINIDTDLRLAFTTGVRETTKKHLEVFDPREILKPAKELIYKVAVEKIRLFGSANKA